MIIYAGVLLLLVILGVLARNEKLPQSMEETGIARRIYQIGGFFYHRFLRRKRALEVTRIKKDLNTVTPSNKGEEQVAEFYIRKIGVSVLLIGAGCLLAMVLWYQGRQNQELEINGQLERSGYGGMVSQEELIAETEDGESLGQYNVTIDSRKYTQKELQDLQKELSEKMPDLIRGSNRSLQEVRSDLNLIPSEEGYPFAITWSTTNYRFLLSSGQIGDEEIPEEGVLVTAIAEYSVDEFKTEQKIDVLILPPVLSEEALQTKEMEELIEKKNEESKTAQYQTLPDTYSEKKIVWKKPLTDQSMVLFAVILAAGILIYFLKDEQLKEQIKGREESLIKVYPQLISKLVLYLGAGMTIRGIFEKLCLDYEKDLKEGGARSYAYDEIRILVHEMQTGIPEGTAYERFGVRCRCQPYTRLVNLLSQNLKKGNGSLLPLLRQEAAKAASERLNIARKTGEKVTTKLLAPMMLILGIVMITIMFPAFQSF